MEQISVNHLCWPLCFLINYTMFNAVKYNMSQPLRTWWPWLSWCTWLQEVFAGADIDQSGEIDEFEMVRVMKKIDKGVATVKIHQKHKVGFNLAKNKCWPSINTKVFNHLDVDPVSYLLYQNNIFIHKSFTQYILNNIVDDSPVVPSFFK